MKGYNWKKLIVIMLISALIGALIGATGAIGLRAMLENGEMTVWVEKLNMMAPGLYVVALIFGIIGLVGYFYLNGQLKKEGYSIEEDSFYEKHEKMMSIIAMCSTICVIINFTAIGVNLYNETTIGVLIAVNVIVAFVGEVLHIALIKKVRPELDADPLDTKFKDNYYDKLDEYEKNKIGKACYQTVATMTMVYVGAFIACYIITLVFEVSPVICLPVGIIWLIQTILMVCYGNKGTKA